MGKEEKEKYDAPSSVHLNRNIMCAIDIVTTGDSVEDYDMLEICILPLTSTCKPSQIVTPYYNDIAPRKIHNINDLHERKYKCSIEKITDGITKGQDYYDSSDTFKIWFKEKLAPAFGKKIMPLAYNWPEKQPWIKEWMGAEYNDYFDWRFRDILSASLFINDRADLRVEQIPYPKQTLSYLAACLTVEHESQHKNINTLDNVQVIGEIYRRMLGSLMK